MTANKFKIGQSVRLRPSVQAGRAAVGEYRIVWRFLQTDGVTRYCVRNSVDEHEVVVKESELLDR